jgi:hypothetical protein
MLESTFRIEVLDAFEALTHALSILSQSVQAEIDLMAWVQNNPHLHASTSNAREKAITILNQLQYLDEQDPREILICAGFVGASSQTLAHVAEVNQAKERFKKSILALKAANIPKTDPFLTAELEAFLNTRHPHTAHTLKRMGLTRLHLKQCYRKIPILKHPPKKISWTWAHTRSIKKISVLTAQALLLKKGNDPGIQMQLKKLSQLAPHEPLAIVQELAPHLRTNIVFHQASEADRKMIKGPIPIFFPCDKITPLPDFKPPSEKCGRDQNRTTRSDVKLEPVLFLPAIRAHRYRNA